MATATAEKCVHKGCGKLFTDPEEACVYHPGPPEFHEGQKGWKCCKPRVLTFDEFLDIPPCTTGKHSAINDTPAPPPSAVEDKLQDTTAPKPRPIETTPPVNGTVPRVPQQARPTPPAVQKEEREDEADDSDDPDKPITSGAACKRRGCNITHNGADHTSNDEQEKCVHHPGQPIFHEGSKGWTCCKRRVLEFDEFMRIPGCTERPQHCFIGGMRKKRRRKAAQSNGKDEGSAGNANDNEEEEDEWERLKIVRHDFYQTPNAVHASFFLKKIDKNASIVRFSDNGENVELDLKTADKKRYASSVPFFAEIDAAASAFRVLGTKLELTLIKKDTAVGWPVLRADEKLTGEIIQTGRAGRA